MNNLCAFNSGYILGIISGTLAYLIPLGYYSKLDNGDILCNTMTQK